MGFHSYTRPADAVIPSTLTRSGFVFDADRVSSNVRLRLAYSGGPVVEDFSRGDSTSSLVNASPALVVPGFRWSQFQSVFGTLNGEGYCPGGTGAIYLQANGNGGGMGRTDFDITTRVKLGASSTGQVGLTLRTSGNDHNNVFLDGTSLRVGASTIQASTPTFPFTGSTVLTAGTYYLLRVTCVGNNYTVYLNGSVEGTFTTAANATGNTHGLYVSGDAAARFSSWSMAAASNPAATAYSVRNWDGAIVTSGSVTSDTVDVADSALTQRSGRGPYGWYRVYLTGPDHGDGQWGTAYGDCTFYRVRGDVNFPANKGAEYATAGVSFVDEHARAVMALGPQRFNLGSGSAAPAGAYTAELAAATALKAEWADLAWPSRPRRQIGAFPNGTATPTNVTATVNYLKGQVTAWEPRNEPQGTAAATFVTEQQAFYNAVKAADTNAKVLGPNPVSFNSSGTQWLTDFFAAGGGAYLDGVSVHGYNCSNGDLQLARSTMSSLRNVLAIAGYPNLPIYQTEQGFGFSYDGLTYPRYAARWTALQIFVQELYGIPVENNHYWYDVDGGFDQFPMFWISGVGPGPQALPIRTMVAEIGNRTLAAFDGGVDFGNYGNKIYAGGLWNHPSDGTKTLGVIGAASGLPALTLTVAGASSLVCSDSWGNTFTATVNAGAATLPVMEFPTWVRIPTNVTVTVNKPLSAPILSTTATASTTGAAANIARIVSGTLENEYGYSSSNLADSTAPYSDTAATYPQTITVDLGANIAATRIVLWGFSPWQGHSTPVDFDLDTWDGAAWTNRYTQTPPASLTFPFTSLERCTLETYWDDRWVHVASFVRTSFSKVRLVLRAPSYGGYETALAHQTLWGVTVGQRTVLQELAVFDQTTLVATSGTRTRGALKLA
jgi:hypothetical protein